MAILVIAEIPGGTVEQYEAVSRAIGFRDPDFEPPAGLISHTAGVTGDGILIADVWDSPESFGRFADQQLGPAAEGAGVDVSTLEPRFVPVHYRLTGKC